MQFCYKLSNTILLLAVSTLPAIAQNAKVEISKRSAAIPKACEQLVPTKTENPIDIPALAREAYCKGSGDMLGEYTYVTQSSKRQKDKNGKEKAETYTYEVFFPTLKSGTHTKGIFVVTAHNGVPVPPSELEKERVRAAERTEREEEKLARETPAQPAAEANSATGILPVGAYARTSINRETLGRKHSASLSVHTFLRKCTLTLARRSRIDGRETLIFTFSPIPDAQFADNEKYMAQLTGEVWIDAADRIVTRLIGWPLNAPVSATANASQDQRQSANESTSTEKPPAIYVELMRLPQPGIWLPRVSRLNGADYPRLFDGITTDSSSTYSNYIRFSTEVQDVKVGQPNKP